MYISTFQFLILNEYGHDIPLKLALGIILDAFPILYEEDMEDV